jgi:hypothetical protein
MRTAERSAAMATKTARAKLALRTATVAVTNKNNPN